MKCHVSDGLLVECFDSDCVEDHTVPATNRQVSKILSKTSPYKKWHKEIVELSEQFEDFTYGRKVNLDAASFQVINFLAYRPKLAFNRDQLDMVQNKLSSNRSRDVIQLVNKTDQRGLERFSFVFEGKVYYGLPEISFNPLHVSKRKLHVDEEYLKSNEKFVRSYYQKLATQEFEIGHRDPRFPLEAGNITMQPAQINRSHRDNYIFDEYGLISAPNPEKLAENPQKFYGMNDLRKIYEGLKQFFEPSDAGFQQNSDNQP